MSNQPPSGHAANQQPGLEPALLAELTRVLLPFLGPYSITTVKRASRLSSDPDVVIRKIAGNIDEPDKRELFSKSATRILLEFQQQTVTSKAPFKKSAPKKIAPDTDPNAAASGRGVAPITIEHMQRGEAALAPIIGPLAGVLVQRYARATDNSRDFFERLATHLRTPDERSSFFASVRS